MMKACICKMSVVAAMRPHRRTERRAIGQLVEKLSECGDDDDRAVVSVSVGTFLAQAQCLGARADPKIQLHRSPWARVALAGSIHPLI